MKRFGIVSLIAVLTLLVAACAPVTAQPARQQGTTTVQVLTPSIQQTGVPVNTLTPASPGVVTATPAAPGTQTLVTPIPNTGLAPFPELASKMVGSAVDNMVGENLGTVTDLIVNPELSRVDYLAVEYNDPLRAGRSTTLVPWEAFLVKPEQVSGVLEAGVFYLNADLDVLHNAPQANLSQIDFSQPSWGSAYSSFWQNHFQSEPRPEMGGGGPGSANRPSAVLFSSLLTTPLMGSSGQNVNLGTVQDAVVDQVSGLVDYVLMLRGRDNQLVPVPFNHLTMAQQNGALTISVDQALFDNAPVLNPTALQGNITPNWDQNIRSYWSSL